MVEKWCRSVSYTRKRLSRSGGNKKIAKRDFYFFSNLPKSRVGGFEKLFIKKLWPQSDQKNNTLVSWAWPVQVINIQITCGQGP